VACDERVGELSGRSAEIGGNAQDVPFHRVPVRCPMRVGRVLPVVVVKGIGMDKNAFGSLVDQTGLTLTDQQKSVLFEVYPLFQAMIVRATPPMPREAEPSLIFMPEVK
jgi:hypothetical protein